MSKTHHDRLIELIELGPAPREEGRDGDPGKLRFIAELYYAPRKGYTLFSRIVTVRDNAVSFAMFQQSDTVRVLAAPRFNAKTLATLQVPAALLNSVKRTLLSRNEHLNLTPSDLLIVEPRPVVAAQ